MVTNKTIIIGSDHRGFEYKQYLVSSLKTLGYNIIDVGTNSPAPVDYPNISKALAQEIKKDKTYKGILICGSGVGISIAANRFSFIRAALVYNEQVAKTCRNHNDANVIVLGSDHITKEQALKFIQIFITSSFEGGRHQNRVDLLSCM